MKSKYDFVVLSHHGCGTGWLRGIFRALTRRGRVDLDVVGGLAEARPNVSQGAASVMLDVNAGTNSADQLFQSDVPCVHFVCDPRQALVESYFYLRAKQQAAGDDDLSVEQGLLDLIDTFPMGQQLQGWTDRMWQRSQLVRHEDLRQSFAETLANLAPAGKAWPDNLMQDLTRDAGPDTASARTLAPQPWQTYFTDRVGQAFYARYGWLGPKLGYWEEPANSASEVSNAFRVLVLGGSNSVMNPGYVYSFVADLQALVPNRTVTLANSAVGANSCMRGLVSAKDANLAVVDVVVIEYFINDLPLYYKEGPVFWLATFEGLVRYTLSCNPCAHIVVLLLGRRDEKFFAIQDAMRVDLLRMADKYGLHILDFDAIVKSSKSGSDFDALYTDGLHYSLPTTLWIAAELAREVERLSHGAPPPRAIATIQPLSPYPFTAAQSVKFDTVVPSDFERRDMSNSRYKILTVRLPEGRSLVMQPGGPLLSISYASTSDSSQLVIQDDVGMPRIVYTLHEQVKQGKFRVLLKTTSFAGEPWNETDQNTRPDLHLSIESDVKDRIKAKIFQDPQMLDNGEPGEKSVYLDSWLEYRPETEVPL